MKYKNITNGTLKFRAANVKGEKQVFELKPGQEFETDREAKFSGLELVNPEKVEKVKKVKKEGD